MSDEVTVEAAIRAVLDAMPRGGTQVDLMVDGFEALVRPIIAAEVLRDVAETESVHLYMRPHSESIGVDAVMATDLDRRADDYEHQAAEVLAGLETPNATE